MKNYKKIVTTIIVAFTIVFVLSGCQKKDSKESDSTETITFLHFHI